MSYTTLDVRTLDSQPSHVAPWVAAIGRAGLLCSLAVSGCQGGDGTGLDASGNPMTASTAANTPSAFAATWKGVQDHVFTPICTQCHIGAGAPLGLRFEEAVSYELLITQRRASVEQPSLLTVEPGNPDGSYLIRKIEGWPSITGGRMPLGLSPLPQDAINTIRNWIAAGAPRTKGAIPASIAPPDLQPPLFYGPPVARSNGSTGAWVQWLPATDGQTPSGAMTYRVYACPVIFPLADATPVLETPPAITSAYLSGLALATTYRIGVRARDQAGNLSDYPGEALLATGLLADTTPPRCEGLIGTRLQDASFIHCWWQPAMDDFDPPDALVYRVTWTEIDSPGFPDDTSRMLVTAPGATHVMLSGLRRAARYRIAVSVGDTSGNWSPSHGYVDVATPP